MSSDLEALAALGVAAALSALLTPTMARLARRGGILDRPVGYKGHGQPTPYLGGTAILLSVLAATMITAGVSSPVPEITVCAVAVCALGTLDDWRPIPPAIRLVAHAALAAAIWEAGAGWGLASSDGINLVLTIGWVVLATNTLNLIDNLDGTAGAAAAGSALGIAVIALTQGGADWAALLAAGLLGSCLGFLPYNLAKPSRIFLGDGGSNLLGFLLSVAIMGAVSGQSGAIGLVAAVLLIGTAIIDTALTITSRWRRGVNPLTGGRDHVTHRVNAWVGSPQRTAAVIGAVQIVLSGLAVAAVELGAPALPLAAAMALVLGGSVAMVVWRGGFGSVQPGAAPIPPIGGLVNMARDRMEQREPVIVRKEAG